MPIGLGLIVFMGLILLANIVEARQNSKNIRRFIWLLLGMNGAVLLLGLALATLPPDFWQDVGLNQETAVLNWQSAGFSVAGMGLWGVLVCLPPVRRFWAKLTPLQADSAVHALALILAGYLVGNTVFSLTQGGLAGLAETAVAASIYEILLTQAIFISIALLGVGLYTRRSPRDTRQRLGLERPTRHQLLVGLGWIMVLVFMQSVAGAIWLLLDSSQAELLEGISSELFGNIDTLAEWLLLAAATGLGEELLFRGAVQPVLGLGFTSFLFAAAHVQYGITPVTVVVFFIGIILGLIRRRYNTSTAIFVHAGYNFVLGLLSLIALQLEQMVG